MLLADQQWIPGVVVGVFLLGLSGLWIWGVHSTWQRQRIDPDVNPRERDFYSRQHRRRLQMAILVGLIGVMIPLGDSVIDWSSQPRIFGYYWLVVLMLSVWVLLLGFGDLAAIRSHHLPSLQSLKDRQRALQARVAELREETERLKQSGSQSG
jgi:hypothetical protein